MMAIASRPKPPALSLRKYAAHRGVDERSVRKHVQSGLLTPALTPDRKIMSDVADVILVKELTRPSGPPPALADARKRKLLIQTVILADEVLDLRAGLVPPADVRALERATFTAAAEILAKMIVPLALSLAGAPPHAAFTKLEAATFDALTMFSAADIVGEVPLGAGEAEEAAPAAMPLDEMDAVGLAACKAGLEAQRLEILRAKARGELVEIEAEFERLSGPILNCRTAVLGLAHKFAPSFQHLTGEEATTLLKGAVREVVDHLASANITAAELRAAVDRAGDR
jgi:hypothetical protein